MKLMRYKTPVERLGDRYRLEAMLGSGGMADVCLAWDEREEREVAIKIVKEDNLDQKALDRFQKEASHVAGWDHPHILRIYDGLKLELLNAKQGSIIPYIVVEYAQGGDLHKRLRPNQPYPLKDALALFEQICSAVQYAHEHGVIHRDLKPLNILFRVLPDGKEQAVLSDFGLAVQINATHHTFANAGTLAYMAPEQFQGHSTPASDIFALGVIFYQLCTGKLPFRRSLQDLASINHEERPALPSNINPLLPGALDEVILTAFAQEQTKRFPTAAQFWEAVRTAVDATTMPSPISILQETTDQPAQSVPHHSAKLVPPTAILPVVIEEPLASQRSDFINMVPAPIKSIGSLSHQQSVLEHVPTAKLDEASTNSSIRSMPGNQKSGLQVPNTINTQMLNGYQQNIVVPSPIVDALATGPGSPPTRASAGSPPPGRRRRRGGALLVVLIALLLLTLLVCGSFALAAPNSPLGSAVNHLVGAGTPGATVTIVPTSQKVTGNFAILGVTGTPNSNQREVQARELTYTTPVQSKTVNATGVVNTSGTRAIGSLTFYNASFAEYTVNAGTVLVGNSGVQVIINSPAYVPAAVFGGGYGTASVAAHAVNVGANGNIGVLDISKVCCGSGSVFVKNLAAFSGGQDPYNGTVVQQSDIDNVANPRVNSAEQNALMGVKGQSHSNEQFFASPKCAPNVNANPPVGSKSATVTVSVSATCSGEVYDHSGTIAMAASSLQNQARKVPGTGYKLVGQIVPTITQLTVVDSKGTISMAIHAEGIWEYNFDSTQEGQLAQKIAGKSQQVAQAILAGQTGVGKVVSISIASGNTLPTDQTQIHFVIQDAPGMTGTPTGSGSPTTITPTVGPGTPQPGSG